MAKAMLIMDMPKCCALCELYYSQVGLPKCTATWRTIDFKNTEVRQEWCPLREIPKKKKEERSILKPYEDTPWHKRFVTEKDVEAIGYNACIDEILGGGE